MNRISLFLLAVLIGGAFASSAHGHGFTLSQLPSGGLLLDTQGNSREYRVGYVPTPPTINDSGNPYTFAHLLDLIGAPNNDMNHGAIGLVSSTTDDLDPADSYKLEFAGPVWFSTGGAATRSTSPLSIVSNDSTNLPLDTLTLDANSGLSLLTISAHSSHSIRWTLPDSAADGVYGVQYRALWRDAASSGDYQASNWVTVLMHTAPFNASQSLASAQLAVTAVPEPSSCLLALLGSLSAVAVVARRRAWK